MRKLALFVFVLAASVSVNAGIIAFDISPDSKYIVTAYEDGGVALWDISVETPVQVYRIKAHESYLTDVVFFSDGSSFITSGSDGKIASWLTSNGLRNWESKPDEWSQNALSFSPDGKTVVSAGGGKRLYVWNPLTGALLRKSELNNESIGSFAFFPDGKRIAVIDEVDNVSIWDFETGALVSRLEEVTAPPGGKMIVIHGTAICISADGKSIYSSALGGKAVRRDAVTGKVTGTWDMGAYGGCSSIAISKKGGYVYFAGNGTVLVVNTSTDAIAGILEDYNQFMSIILVLSPDGRYLFYTGLPESQFSNSCIIAVDLKSGLVHLEFGY